MSTFSGKAAGAYGARGGVISFEFIPDPNEIANKIMALAGYLENVAVPLEASKGIAKADMQNHFDTETGPNGEAWAPLSEETIKRWGEHSILQLTGAMRGAATSDAAYLVDGSDLFFSTEGLPSYWIFHETGRSLHHIRAFAEENPHLEIDIHTGGMPPRPFVGLSFEAELQIIELFDAWFEGGVAGFYTRPSGRVQQILRTPGGGHSFGPMVG